MGCNACAEHYEAGRTFECPHPGPAVGAVLCVARLVAAPYNREGLEARKIYLRNVHPCNVIAEAFAHITFDEGAGENYVAVTQSEDVGDADGGTYDKQAGR